MKRAVKTNASLNGMIVGLTTGAHILDRLIPHLAAEAELRTTTQRMRWLS